MVSNITGETCSLADLLCCELRISTLKKKSVKNRPHPGFGSFGGGGNFPPNFPVVCKGLKRWLLIIEYVSQVLQCEFSVPLFRCFRSPPMYVE